MKIRYKVLFITLMSLLISGFMFVVVFYSIQLSQVATNHEAIDEIVKPMLIFMLLITVLMMICLFVYRYYEVRCYKKMAYFSKDVEGLANLAKFTKGTKKIYSYNKKKKVNKTFIACLGASNFEELKLSTLTEEETKEMLIISANYLTNRFNEKNIVAYDDVGRFYICISRESQADAINDIHEVIRDIGALLAGKTYTVSLSFCAGLVEVISKDVPEFVKEAAIARFYNAKNSNVDVLIYEESMKRENRDNMEMKHEIERAIANHEFEVFYQPKFNIKLNRFVGAEALVRWNHPEKGLLGPGAFIPFAEQNGQIVDIDRYVFEQVCRDIVSWKENKTRLLLISINLSRNEIFKEDIIDFYKSTIEKYHVSPLLIEIEVTESAVTKDMLYTCNVIQQLKKLRFKTSMDDFGTGYSSLSYLKKMPVDTLKLDKSFFDEIEIDKRSRDIVATTIKLAKALEMTVVAEGIQTKKQVQILKDTECDCIQGYYYSTPKSKIEYEAFLRKNEFE